MKQFQDLLSELGACNQAREWAAEKSIADIVSECHRGDWLLWLASRIPIDKRKLVLAKGMCANTVRHLMEDERSTKAVDVAIGYGNGEVTEEQLIAAYAAASAAYAADAAAADAAAYAADADADAAAADAAAYAADADADAAAADAAAYAAAADAAAYADAADAAAYAAAAAAAADAAAYADAADAAAYAAARKENQMKTADICREVIGQLIVERVMQMLGEAE